MGSVRIPIGGERCAETRKKHAKNFPDKTMTMTNFKGCGYSRQKKAAKA